MLLWGIILILYYNNLSRKNEKSIALHKVKQQEGGRWPE